MMKSQQTPSPTKPTAAKVCFKCSSCTEDYDSSSRKPLQICSKSHSVFICTLCRKSMEDGLLQSICTLCNKNIEVQDVRPMTDDQLIDKIKELIQQANYYQQIHQKQIKKLEKQQKQSHLKLQQYRIKLIEKQQELDLMQKKNNELQQQSNKIAEQMKIISQKLMKLQVQNDKLKKQVNQRKTKQKQIIKTCISNNITIKNEDQLIQLLNNYGSFPNMKQINLYNRQISNEGLTHLSKLANLQKIDLGHNQISDEWLTHLSK